MALQFENNSFGPGNKPKSKKISGGQKKLDNPLANALMGGTPAANPMGGTEMDFDMPDMGAMQMNAPSPTGGYGMPSGQGNTPAYQDWMDEQSWTHELDQNTGQMVYGPPTGKFDLDPYKDPSGSSAGGGIDDPVGMAAQPTGMAGFSGAAPAGRSGMVAGDMAGPGGQEQYPYEPIDWPTDGDGRKMKLDNPYRDITEPLGGWETGPYGGDPTPGPRPDVINNMGGAQSPQGFGWDDPMMGQPDMGGMPMDTPMMNDPMMGQPDMGGPMMNDPMMGGMPMGQPDMGQPFMGDPMMGMQGQPQQGQQGDQPDMGGGLGMKGGGGESSTAGYEQNKRAYEDWMMEQTAPMRNKMWDMTNEGWDKTQDIVDEINTGNPYGDRLAGRSSFAGGQPSSGGDALSNALRGPQADFPEAPVAGPETASLPTVSQLDQEVAPSVSEVPAILPPAVREVAPTVDDATDFSGFTDDPVAPTVSLPPTVPPMDPTGDTPEPGIDPGFSVSKSATPEPVKPEIAGGPAGSLMDSDLLDKYRAENPGQPDPILSGKGPTVEEFKDTEIAGGPAGALRYVPTRENIIQEMQQEMGTHRYNGETGEWERKSEEEIATLHAKNPEWRASQEKFYKQRLAEFDKNPPEPIAEVSPEKRALIKKLEAEGAFGVNSNTGKNRPYHDDIGQDIDILNKAMESRDSGQDKPALEEFKDKVDAGEVSDEEPADKKPEQVTVDGKKYWKESDRGKPGVPESGIFSHNGRLLAIDGKDVWGDPEADKPIGVPPKEPADKKPPHKTGEFPPVGNMESGLVEDYYNEHGEMPVPFDDTPPPTSKTPVKPALEEFKDKVDAGEVSDEPNKQWEELSQYDKDSYNKMYGEAELKEYIEEYGQIPPRTGGQPNADGKFDLRPPLTRPNFDQEETSKGGEGKVRTVPIPGDRNWKRVTANNGEEGWRLSERGSPGIGNYGDFVDKDGEIVSFEEPERDPNILRRFDAGALPPGRAQLPQDAIGTASSESRSVAQEADLGPPDKREGFNRDDWEANVHGHGVSWSNSKTGEQYEQADSQRFEGEDKFSEVGDAAYGEEDRVDSIDDFEPSQPPEEGEGLTWENPTDEEKKATADHFEQRQQEMLGSDSPEDINNPANWLATSDGQYVYGGAEFGKRNTNPPADTEDWARTRAAAASKTSGSSAAPEIYLPPDTFGLGDGGGPSDQERKKADKMERDDYDLSPGIDNVPLDLMQDEYGDIDSYNARMLEVTPGSTTREELAERDVTFPQQQQLVNKEWGEQWGDAFQQALSPTGRQRVSRPGMTSGSGNEMQTMAAANAMLGGRMAEQLIPHKYALQHSEKVKNLLAFANQEGIDMANLLQSDWYSGANDLAKEEAINQVIQNAAANNRATSWR